jgi:acyl transferase domain-containing protein/acyl carrier protein
MSDSKRHQLPIAVVGASALFPGSSDARGFWSDILAGRDLITDVPATHWLAEDYYDPDPTALDKTYCKRGAFLSPIDFDPMEFGVPPSIVPATDTAQILALIVAQKVLEDAAQGQFATMDRERISVLLGVTSAQELLGSMVSRLQRPVWLKALRESGIPETEAQAVCERIAKSYVPWQESSFPGLLGNVVAGRIANRFDLRGTNAVTDAACASSMAAVSMGVNELQLGQSDLVITGGVDAMNDIFMYMCFSKTPALSPSGDCRPFSDTADGTLLGEGMAMLALKRLEDAERDGDRVYAVLTGIGSASDGRSKSVYAPLPEGQARALRRAYEVAGYDPATVELVEAHGTGTKAGDAAEFEGLKIAFGESARKDNQWCALGTVKSQIGHTKAAAGAAGLFKAVMALHHKVLPPTIKIDRPNPKLAIETSPFYLNTQRRPWIRDASHPRRASVSSFGFGGSNFHIALEEYVPKNDGIAKGKNAWRYRTAPTELVLLSAPNAADLSARCRTLASSGGDLDRVARESQRSFRTGDAARLAVVAASTKELSEKLTQVAAAITKAPDASYTTPTGIHYAAGTANAGQVAFLYPGQGSQYVGMGSDVAMAFDAARAAWDAAASQKFAGESLHDVVFPRPVFTDAARDAQTKKLTSTEWAQPALGVQSMALANVLHAVGIRPHCVAGHSFGEVAALHEAGALTDAAFVRVSRRRGELMRDAAAAPGAMTAVARPIDEVRSLLAEIGADVVIANHNAPTQVVLSGATDAIARVEEALAAKGITAKRLPVATAFHSPLVAGSSAPFLAHLSLIDVGAPTIDVYGNADANPYPKDADAVRERLATQLAKPVRFVDQIEAMYARGVRTFVEVGAGSVLTELVGRILGEREHLAVNLDRKGKNGVSSLQEALGRLATGGVAMDLSVLWAAYAPASDKPAKKPAMAMPISGINYGKPYPPPGGAKDLPPANPPRPIAHAPSAVALASAPAPTSMMERAPAVISTSAPAAAPEVHVAWVQAYQEAQRQTADAHSAYQRSMADSHLAFLKTAETSFAGLSAMLTGEPPVHAVSAIHAPVVTHAPAVMPAFAAPPPALVHAPVVHAPVVHAPLVHAPVVQAASPAVDLEALLLAIVAEKTGYPAEMLGGHMELEADLGIDSIKRVEILSAMRERAPGLREVKPTELAALRTLGQIVDHMRAHGGAAVAASGANGTNGTNGHAHVTAPAAGPAVDLEALLLAIVAEKTGYPAEMLGGHMELEADLGIDSIKRVEILSAMRERAPGLREVKPTELAALRTLGQIVDHMRSHGTNGNGSATKSNGPVAPSGAKAVDAPAPESASAIERFAVREIPAPAVGMALAGVFTAGRIVVTDEGTGLAVAVVARLAESGVHATVVSQVPVDANAVVFLGGMRAVSNVDEAVAVNREAFHATRAVAARFATEGGVLVTVQDTGGDFGLSGRDATRAWLGGVSALARTAAREWPSASVKAIDCERGGRSVAAVATAIVNEILGGGSTLEVGLHADGARTTLASVVTVAASTGAGSTLRIGADAVVVASGGARGVTAAALIALAKAKHPRIVLLGRTALEDEPAELRVLTDEAGLKRAIVQKMQSEGRKPTPVEVSGEAFRVLANREIRANVAAMKAAGSEVRYLAVDVQNAGAISTALDAVRKDWGKITAVVHAAGVLADKRIHEKTDEQFDRVFDTKVVGLRALLAATANDPLTAVCLFSSIAARTGNLGQCDYAMANEVLNLVGCAERTKRGDACVVRSIGWGPWEGGMVTPALKSHFEQMGVALIPLDMGARIFVEEMNGGGPDVTIVVGGTSGEGAFGAAASPQVSVEVRVSAKSHPYLADHRVAGVPVVPVTLAMEWMLRGARACLPDLTVTAVRNVKVLRGIKLDRFDHEGDRLVVRCRQTAAGEVAVEVRGHNDALHYSALVAMAPELARSPAAQTAPTVDRWTMPTVYDGHVLFHGARFQVIRAVEGVSRAGIIGTLAGVNEAGWHHESWRSDPAMLDGGLQLALLWTRNVLDGASLPMALGELRMYREGIANGPVLCVLYARQVHDARAVCDIAFVDGTGAVIAEMLGVETVLRPSETASKSTAAPAQA